MFYGRQADGDFDVTILHSNAAYASTECSKAQSPDHQQLTATARGEFSSPHDRVDSKINDTRATLPGWGLARVIDSKVMTLKVHVLTCFQARFLTIPGCGAVQLRRTCSAHADLC